MELIIYRTIRGEPEDPMPGSGTERNPAYLLSCVLDIILHAMAIGLLPIGGHGRRAGVTAGACASRLVNAGRSNLKPRKRGIDLQWPGPWFAHRELSIHSRPRL